MKMSKRLTLPLFIILFIFSACSNQSTSEASKILRLATYNDITTLNSLVVENVDSAQVIANFTEGLTTYSEDGTIIGALAEDWTMSKNGLVYTFKLRDALWQDGVPVTAHDFVFAWQQVATLAQAPYKAHLRNFLNADAVIKGEVPATELGVKALDDKQLQITLRQPTPYLLDLLAFPSFLPIQKAFYEQVGAENYGTSSETVLANGPFILAQYGSDVGYTLKKNPSYWDAAQVDLEEVNVRVVKQAETRASLYESGQIDQLILTSDLYDKYARSSELVVEAQPWMKFLYLSNNINQKDSVLISYNMRAAIAHAIDKDVIVESILKDGSVAADYFLPRGFVSLNNQDFRDYSGKFNTLSYDVGLAQNYFEKAKYELAGKDLTFTISLTDSENAQKIFENIKAQLETNLPGLKVNLRTIPGASYFPILKEHTEVAAYMGWLAGFKDPSTFFEIYHTGKGQNYGLYSNSVFDGLIEQTESSRLALNAERRWNAFVEAEQVLLGDYYLIPLYQQGQVSLIKPHVRGLKLSPTIPPIFYKYVNIQ